MSVGPTTAIEPGTVEAPEAPSSDTTLDRLLLRFMDIVAEHRDIQRAAVVLDRDGIAAVHAEFSRDDGPRALHHPTPIAERSRPLPAVVAHVLQTGERIIMNDAAAERMRWAVPSDAAHAARAVLCAPLAHKGDVRGVLYLESGLAGEAFSEERAASFGALCALLTLSLQSAELNATLKQQVLERTRDLRDAQARLVHLENPAVEGRVVGGFAHEIRNSLTGALLMLSKVYTSGASEEEWSSCRDNAHRLSKLVTDVQDRLPEDVLRHMITMLGEVNDVERETHAALSGISRALRRGLGIAGVILEYTRLGREHAGDEAIHVDQLVASIVEELKEELAAHRIAVDVDIPQECVFHGKQLHIHSILNNLLLNARDALLDVKDSRPRRIRLSVLVDAERLVVAVSDTGVGIPAILQDRIFEPFFSTKGSKGSGFGLGVVRRLASLYGGDVGFESEPGRGTTFRVTLPKRAPAPTNAVQPGK